MRGALFDRGNGIGDDAFRSGHFDGIAGFTAEQDRAERRHIGDLAMRQVGLLRTDDGIEVRLVLAGFLEPQSRADRDRVFASSAGFYERRVLQELIELADAVFDFGLLFAGLVVFGILGQIAELLGIFEVFSDFLAALGLQEIELFGELVILFLGEILGLVWHMIMI